MYPYILRMVFSFSCLFGFGQFILLTNYKYMHIYQILLRLDCAVLKSDSRLTKIIKRKLLKPIGYYFRKLNFKKFYYINE